MRPKTYLPFNLTYVTICAGKRFTYYLILEGLFIHFRAPNLYGVL